jgi:uncharacterized protein
VGDSRLTDNILNFARALRAAGLPLGPGTVIDGMRAVLVAGLRRRVDFYWTLHAVFVHRPAERELFDQAFHIFWRDPKLLERLLAAVVPSDLADSDQEKTLRRVTDALSGVGISVPIEGQEAIPDSDGSQSFSPLEALKHKDFEHMTASEVDQVKAAIARLRLPLGSVATRRMRPHPRGHKVDMRRTLRATLRSGGDIIPFQTRAPRFRPPPFVILCDISGSMSRYSRLLLHFMHAITNDYDRVHCFVFGTQLTNITRLLRVRDVDHALDRVSEIVEDWDGGTRLGACLQHFNRDWSRRVLAQGATVLLMTDGLDREAGQGLAGQAERLQKSCRRFIWLNPLLRFDGFEPKSLGVRALLPHVDEFRPVHNLMSLMDLTNALSNPTTQSMLDRYKPMLQQQAS